MAAAHMLFSPLTLGQVRLPNRIVMEALPSRLVAPAGFADRELREYYAERARGGAGLIVLEAAHVLPPQDTTIAHLGLYADPHVPALRQCVEAVHQQGSAVLIMLDQALPIDLRRTAALERIGEAFIAAAWRAGAAGADGVMLSTADNGPFQQLLELSANRRSETGRRIPGRVDERLNLLLHVVETIGAWLGGRFIVGVRLNVEEQNGISLQDARFAVRRLTSAGVKLLEVTVRPSSTAQVARFPGWCVPLAAVIKDMVEVPVLVGGLLDQPDLANSALRDGSADLIALGERLALEPGWPRLAQEALKRNQR